MGLFVSFWMTLSTRADAAAPAAAASAESPPPPPLPAVLALAVAHCACTIKLYAPLIDSWLELLRVLLGLARERGRGVEGVWVTPSLISSAAALDDDDAFLPLLWPEGACCCSTALLLALQPIFVRFRRFLGRGSRENDEQKRQQFTKWTQ